MIALPDFTARIGKRRVNGWLGGADAGLALVFHPGTPSPPVRWDSLDVAARERDLRLISYARPGYSGSTRQPGRTVSAAAGDTAAVLDELGATEFVTVGHSGGGPHALACGALLPDRCRAVVALGSVAPFDARGLDWWDGMADENVAEFTTALEGSEVLRPFLAGELEQYADVTGEDIAIALGGLVPDVDRAALSGELADMYARTFRRAAYDGIEGWLDDDLAFTNHWGFDLATIAPPVGVWQGKQDRMVPFAHGEWLQAHLPTSRSRLLDEEGHLSLLTTRLTDILDDILELSRIGLS